MPVTPPTTVAFTTIFGTTKGAVIIYTVSTGVSLKDDVEVGPADVAGRDAASRVGSAAFPSFGREWPLVPDPAGG